MAPVEGLAGLFWQANFLPICRLLRAKLMKSDSELNGAAAFRFKLNPRLIVTHRHSYLFCGTQYDTVRPSLHYIIHTVVPSRRHSDNH